MNRIDRILSNHIFQQNLKKNQDMEKDRIFCKHQLEHFLDVARIAMIMNLEEHYGIEKDLIYGVSLLHDIGKNRQYAEDISHEQASAELAVPILEDAGFSKTEVDLITDAILNHRSKEVIKEKNLRGLLYRADKASRPCFFCAASSECNWNVEKRNLSVLY